MEKLFKDINDLAAEFDCNPSKLRFYEKKFNLPIQRNKSGDRIYTKKDVEKLKEIFALKKEEGYTIQTAQKQLLKKESIKKEKNGVAQSLLRFKRFLEEINNELST